MPELPEAETVRRGLARLVVGRQILAIDVLNEKSFPNAANDVAEFLIGAKIIDARRRAKVLILDLDTKYSLVIHLKMTGQIIFRDGRESWGAGHPNDSFVHELPDRSTRVIFDLSSPRQFVIDPESMKLNSSATSSTTQTASRREVSRAADVFADDEVTAGDGGNVAKLFFNDQRKFGWVKLIPTAEIPNMSFMQKVGPEPLVGDPFPEFLRRVRRRNGTTIKAAILDQSVVAGIGNIYADEALWAAKVHPATRVRDLSDNDLRNVLRGAIDAMNLSLEKGGSTDRNYVDAEGKKGSYLSFANVFRREGQPCPRCGAIIEKIRVAGRGTHICPQCQKEPK